MATTDHNKVIVANTLSQLNEVRNKLIDLKAVLPDGTPADATCGEVVSRLLLAISSATTLYSEL